jgi:putative ABC transport system permease protein
MLKNFLKIAYRNLFKYKYYSLINIIGFSIGLAAYIFANLYAQNEHSFDNFHSKSNRIFRIANVYEKDSTLNEYATNPFPLSKALMNEFPDFVEESVRLFNFETNFHLVEYHNKHFNEKNFFYTDSNFLNVFDIQIIVGKKENALKQANSVLISQNIRKKYFGEFNPIGKTILVDEVLPLVVTGVFEDFPEQSHFHPQILTPISSLNSFMQEPNTWLWSPCWTYILLKEQVNAENVEKKFPDFIRKYFDPQVKDFTSLYLQPITDIHLSSNLEKEIERNNKAIYINTLIIVSFFLLIVSLLNFTNLTFVGSITRLREVSIRKILGAAKRNLIAQFVTESIISAIIAAIFALFLIETFVNVFVLFTDENLEIARNFYLGIIIKMIIIAIISGLIVGFYTGFCSSLFPTFNLAKFKQKLSSNRWLAGKILIMLQYTISLIILIVVIVNFKQLLYFKNSNLGFNKENLIVMPVGNTPVSENYEDFKNDLVKNKNIHSVSTIDHIIGTEHSYRRYFYEENGIKKAQFFPQLIVRNDFINTLEIKLLAGSEFGGDMNSSYPDSDGELIINESMVKQLKFKNNNEAINKKLVTFKGNEKIVGVINDFSSRSLHSHVSPLVIRLSSNDAAEDVKYLILKISRQKKAETIKSLEKLWRKYAPNRPFEFYYLENVLELQYKNEVFLNNFLWIFSILTIIISCMGIWAVTSLFSIRRTKEIGIRKVLGASVSEILTLFIKGFFNILIISNLIAWPMAWLILNSWFKNFANHISIQLLDFLLASLIIFALSLIIVIRHALIVANSNSINSLRDE